METRDLGSAPVLPDAPAGADPAYEPEFEALQAEIDKLSKVSQDGQGVDWAKVVSLSQVILAQKGKHLLVASYLSAGLTATSGLPGLATGVHVLKDMVETYWDGLFPPAKRMRGRIAALTWWKERAKIFLAGLSDIPPLQPALVRDLTTDVEALDRALSEKTEEAPVLRDLTEAIQRLPVQEEAPPPPDPAPEVQSPAAPASPEPPAQASRPQAPPAASLPDPGNDPKALFSAGLGLLQRAAESLRGADLTDPLSYRLVRLAAWMPVHMLPPADQNRTMVPPPDEAVRAALARLLVGRQYEELIRAAESRVPEHLFWLDLSRYSAQALDAMGSRCREASDAVGRATILFTRALPGIEALSFSDDSPFADAQTRAWLRGLTASLSQTVPSDQAQPDENKASDELLSKVRSLAADKKFLEAVSLLQEGLRTAGSGKERFTLLISLARLLGDSGRADLARPNVEELVSLIDEYKLEKWDPDTALRGFLAAFEALRTETDEDAKTKARMALMRVARINPAAAMRLGG